MGNILKILFVMLLFASCSSARIDTSLYDNYVNGNHGAFLKEYEHDIFNYREASSGGYYGKKGGGCGCN